MSFPSSPANNTTTVVNGINYIYNASFDAWKRVPGDAVQIESVDSVSRAHANGAFEQANNVISSSSYANSAYTQANTVINIPSQFLLMGA